MKGSPERPHARADRGRSCWVSSTYCISATQDPDPLGKGFILNISLPKKKKELPPTDTLISGVLENRLPLTKNSGKIICVYSQVITARYPVWGQYGRSARVRNLAIFPSYRDRIPARPTQSSRLLLTIRTSLSFSHSLRTSCITTFVRDQRSLGVWIVYQFARELR